MGAAASSSNNNTPLRTKPRLNEVLDDENPRKEKPSKNNDSWLDPRVIELIIEKKQRKTSVSNQNVEVPTLTKPNPIIINEINKEEIDRKVNETIQRVQTLKSELQEMKEFKSKQIVDLNEQLKAKVAPRINEEINRNNSFIICPSQRENLLQCMKLNGVESSTKCHVFLKLYERCCEST